MSYKKTLMIETISILGRTISIYYLFWFFAMIASFVVGLWLRNEYHLTTSKAIIYISLTLSIGVLLVALTSWICGGGKMIGMNYVRIVHLFWIYFWVLARLLKDPYKKMSDYLTIIVGWFYIFAHSGCLFPGCCHGYPSQWGIYSNAAGYVCFPVQVIEIVINVTISFILLWMRKQEQFQGILNPWYMFMFGSTRIVTEFFRDNEKLFWGLSEMALHAVVALLLGSAALIVIYYRKGKRAHNEKAKQ